MKQVFSCNANRSLGVSFPLDCSITAAIWHNLSWTNHKQTKYIIYVRWIQNV